MWFDIFRFTFAAVFIGLHIGIMAGLFREWRYDRRLAGISQRNGGPEASRPTVSVVVPVRNEESCVAGLLESLSRQDYPNTEFIFIDDASTDKSPELLRRFASERPAARIITLKENPGTNRKQYALNQGINAARGSLLLFTDADCETPPRWISAMAARMEDKNIALTIGPVFKKAEAESAAPRCPAFFRQYQCFDHAVRYLYLAGSTGLGAAGGGFGNNLIVRREALGRIGGYEKVPPSATEDAALVSLIRGRPRPAPKNAAPGKADGAGMAVHAACGRDLWVITKNERTWKALINQTLRWNNGGLFSPDPGTRLNFTFLMVTISLGILAIPALPFAGGLWPLPAAVLFSMAMNTVAVLSLFGPALPKGGPAYLVQIVFTPAYFTFLTILGFCGIKADWKGKRAG
jgi:cellulose synthase/poly-beta-1,6-N-acetylglucosamine synthase-like glycosyltransferase